jgi:hypothetical protein
MSKNRSTIPALRVRQWLPEWSEVRFGGEHQAKPREHFYLFSLSASTLKALAGIQRRDARSGARRANDLGIQRRHDPARSETIRAYVRSGFPWSDLSDRQRSSGKFDDLKKPGWLPTAIVVNILAPDDKRSKKSVAKDDLITITETKGAHAEIGLPLDLSGINWRPKTIEPLEVIDGQHRLWAFDGREHDEDYELPVVAFFGLDLSWQAYLFWTINIKPKRINASLAFDLYPLLRSEDWLQRFEGPSVYRETRAQELTELVWAYSASPWHDRINMLGESGVGGVTQAAWIRSLTHSFVRSWEGRGTTIGGLFGAPVGDDDLVLPWTREQQAAFLIFVWQSLADAIANTDDEWAEILRERNDDSAGDDESDEPTADAAFTGKYSLLNTDQGVRAFSQVANDMCYWMSDELALADWPAASAEQAGDLSLVKSALKQLSKQPVAEFVDQIVEALAHFDWRTSSHPNLTEEQRTLKGAFRGSGGYRELRRQLLKHMVATAQQPAQSVAHEVLDALNLA